MFGTIFALLAAILAIASWFYAGILKWVPLLIAVILTLIAFFEYAKERNGNAAMFLGCLVTWLSAIIQLFLAGYL